MAKKRQKAGKSSHDPHSEREASKYDQPIPSREFILTTLKQNASLMNRDELGKILGLTSDDNIEALRRRLRAMERDGQLIYTRRGYAPVDELELVRGRVIGHHDGFGFLRPEEGGDDLFLTARQMEKAMHGDRVVARITGVDRRGRKEGMIVDVLEHVNERIVGRFHCEQGVCYVSPENRRICQDIMVPTDRTAGAENGQIVTIHISDYPAHRRQAIGQVVEILGDHMAPGMEIDVAMRMYDLPSQWPLAVDNEISGLADEVPDKAKKGRLDLRDMPLVTIDGEDARDFDDAVYCEKTDSGWRLLVAIADVSHYVDSGSSLDDEAINRGNSVYFPERVIPMLPKILSNGLCSLNPQVDRLCMVCELYIDKQGKVYRSRFHDALMRSHARLTYDEVAAMLVDQDSALCQQHAQLLPHLKELYRLYKVMARGRAKRGAIELDITDTRIVFGEDRKIEKIVPTERNDAHRIIEECMIAANVCAARFLLRHRMPALYRVHEEPDAEKLLDLKSFLGEFGMRLPGGKLEPRHFANLLKRIRGRDDAHLIQTVILRTMKQAQYNPDNIGHFGLAHEAYAHFTSPIRRYPDLMIHRAIRHILHGGKAANFAYTHEDLASLGEHSSMTERRADEATRDAVSWLKCEYMMDKVGDTFHGVITAVTSFGIFVELRDIYVEGLVHITSLANDYYHFDPAGHRLRGERTGKTYRLGDGLDVQVVRVDLDDRKIDFDLPGQSAPGSEKTGSRKARSKRRRSRKSGSKNTDTKKAETKITGLKKSGSKKTSSKGTRKKGSRSKRRRSRSD